MKKYKQNTIFIYSITFLILLHSSFLSAQGIRNEQTQTVAPPVQIAQEKRDALKLYREGNYIAAIEVCQAEIKVNPNNIDSYVVLGWSLIANKQYAEAAYWGTEGRKISKYDQRIIEILGEASFYRGKNDDALAFFQEYISLVGKTGSRFAQSYYYMGEIYIRLQQYNHADIAFSQAVFLEPLRDYWWTRLGYAREMAENFKGSILAYEKALSLNAGRTDALLGRDRIRKKL